MSNKGLIVGGIAAFFVITGVGVYAATRPPKETSTPSGTGGSTGGSSTSTSTLTSITLSANATSISVDGQVTFTAIAYDQNGNLYSGASLTLFDKSTSTSVPMGNTNAQGSDSVVVGFNVAGTYVMYAESQSGIESNNVIVTVTTPTPTPTTYTCYHKGTCTPRRGGNNITVYVCQSTAFTSSVPCSQVGAYDSESAACSGVVCNQ